MSVCFFMFGKQGTSLAGKPEHPPSPPPPAFSVSSSSSPTPSLLPFSLCSYSFRAPLLRPSHLSVLSLLSSSPGLPSVPVSTILILTLSFFVSPWESCPPPGSCHFICLEPCCCCCCLVLGLSIMMISHHFQITTLTTTPPLNTASSVIRAARTWTDLWNASLILTKLRRALEDQRRK